MSPGLAWSCGPKGTAWRDTGTTCCRGCAASSTAGTRPVVNVSETLLCISDLLQIFLNPRPGSPRILELRALAKVVQWERPLRRSWRET